MKTTNQQSAFISALRVPLLLCYIGLMPSCNAQTSDRKPTTISAGPNKIQDSIRNSFHTRMGRILYNGQPGSVVTMTLYKNCLVVGGPFTDVGAMNNNPGIKANGVAMWNTAKWTSLGYNLPFTPAVLAATDDTLFCEDSQPDSTIRGVADMPTSRIYELAGDKWKVIYRGAMAGTPLYAYNGLLYAVRRKAVKLTKKAKKGEVNFASLINQKYANSYNIPGVDFDAIINDIKSGVNDELSYITRDIGVDFSHNIFHEGQLLPTFDLCLATKISNQDSLVLISSILPTPGVNDNNVLLFTNDNDFAKSTAEISKISTVLSGHGLSTPSVCNIRSVGIHNKRHDLAAKALKRQQLQSVFNEYMAHNIVNRNKSRLLGTTFTPTSKTLSKDIVCFKLLKDCKIKNNAYVTIIGKNLDFIYTTKNKVTEFHHSGSVLSDGHTSTADKGINVSYTIADKDPAGKKIAPPIIKFLQESGNLVFIHPDS